MSYCNRCVGCSYCNDSKGNVCLFSFVATTLILILPLVQPCHFFCKYCHLVVQRGKKIHSLYKVRDVASPLLSPFERFTFQSGVWYIQASHGPVLQWSSRDKCCQTWRCLLLASVPWASILPLVHRVGTMGQWNGWVV